MKLAGHTMGTPKKDIYEAIDFFAEIGLDGIEVRCAENGHMDVETIGEREVGRILAHAEAAGIEFACLTPYYRDFMTPETTERTLIGYQRACKVAQALSCPTVRAISGVWPQEGYERAEVFARSVEGTRRGGDIATEYGVQLAVETHGGQLTWTAAEALEFIEAIDHPAVGVLWDHYWVRAAGKESFEEAIALLGPHIRHVHAKNIQFTGDTHETVLIDEGELDWAAIIAALADIGYDGFVCDEYEKFWRPHLPEPEIGMKHNAEVLRNYRTAAER